jgi:hypothetical protein
MYVFNQSNTDPNENCGCLCVKCSTEAWAVDDFSRDKVTATRWYESEREREREMERSNCNEDDNSSNDEACSMLFILVLSVL